MVTQRLESGRDILSEEKLSDISLNNDKIESCKHHFILYKLKWYK